jgi:hypothetical protein
MKFLCMGKHALLLSEEESVQGHIIADIYSIRYNLSLR